MPGREAYLAGGLFLGSVAIALYRGYTRPRPRPKPERKLQGDIIPPLVRRT